MPDNEGTGTEPKKSNTVPFSGNNYRSSPYRGTATMEAAAAVNVQKRDNITRNDDVEQSLEDPIVRSQLQCRKNVGQDETKLEQV